MNIETQNLLQYSEDLSQSPWVNTYVTASWVNGWVELTDNDAANTGNSYQDVTLPLSAGDIYTVSLEIKKETSSSYVPEIDIQYNPQDSAVYSQTRINPVTGATGAAGTPPATQTVTVTDLGESWQLALTFPVLSAGNTSVRITISPAIASTVTAAADVAGVGTIYIRNLQLYSGSYNGKKVSVPTTHKKLLYDYSGAGNDAYLGSNGGAAINPVGKYLWLPGVAGNYASTPSINVTGDIDIRIHAATTWQTTRVALASKWGTTLSWLVTSETAGAINFYWNDGTTTFTQTSSAVSFADGADGYVRVTMQVNDGAGNHVIKFYTSTTGITWTQLGTTVTTAGVTTINPSTEPIAVGAYDAGASAPLAGRIYLMQLHNGIDVIARFTPKDSPGDTNNFISKATGEVWTIHAASYTDSHTPSWTPDGLLFNGVSDYISGVPTAAGDTFALANDVFTFSPSGYDTAGGFLGKFLAHSRYNTALTDTQADDAYASVTHLATRVGATPTLNYLFRNTSGVVTWAPYAKGIGTFTRNSTATGAGGIQVKANELRVFGTTTKSPVVLIEGQRTNIIPSTDFSTWGNGSGLTLSYGSTNDVVTTTDTSTTSPQALNGPIAYVSLPSDTAYTASIYIKKEGSQTVAPYMRIQAYSPSLGTFYIGIKMRPDTGRYQVANGASYISTVTISDSGQYWKVAFVCLAPSDTEHMFMALFPAHFAYDWGYSPSYTGTATFAYPQLEQASFPSSYIPTTGTAATRAIESIDVPNVGAQLDSTSNMSIHTAIYLEGNETVYYPSMWAFQNASNDRTDEAWLFARNGVLEFALNNGTFAVAGTIAPKAWLVSTVTKDASNVYSLYINGSFVQQVTSSLVISPSHLWVGALTAPHNNNSPFAFLGLGSNLLDIPFIDNRVWTATEISNAHTAWLAELQKITLL